MLVLVKRALHWLRHPPHHQVGECVLRVHDPRVNPLGRLRVGNDANTPKWCQSEQRVARLCGPTAAARLSCPSVPYPSFSPAFARPPSPCFFRPAPAPSTTPRVRPCRSKRSRDIDLDRFPSLRRACRRTRSPPQRRPSVNTRVRAVTMRVGPTRSSESRCALSPVTRKLASLA